MQDIAENQPERLKEYLMPVDALFTGYKKAQVKNGSEKALANGNKLSGSMLEGLTEEPAAGEDILVYNRDGRFKAIYKREGEEYKVSKMF